MKKRTVYGIAPDDKRHQGSSSKRIRRRSSSGGTPILEECYQEVVWEDGASADISAQLPPRAPSVPSRSRPKSLDRSHSEHEGGRKRFASSSASSCANRAPSQLLSGEDMFSQMDFVSSNDSAAVDKSDEILQLKMDAISSIYDVHSFGIFEDQDEAVEGGSLPPLLPDAQYTPSGPPSNHNRSFSHETPRDPHLNATITPISGSNSFSMNLEDHAFTPAVRPCGSADSLATSGRMSACLPPALYDSQNSEGPSQPDFVDSVVVDSSELLIQPQRVSKEFMVHDGAVNSCTFVSTNLVVPIPVSSLSNHGNYSTSSTSYSRVDKTTPETSQMDMVSVKSNFLVVQEDEEEFSMDVLTQLEALESQAIKAILEKKNEKLSKDSSKHQLASNNTSTSPRQTDIMRGVEVIKSVVISTLPQNAGDPVPPPLDDDFMFDLAAIEALEQKAMSTISERRKSSKSASSSCLAAAETGANSTVNGHVEEDVRYTSDSGGDASIQSKRLVAYSVVNQINSRNGKREKLIRCVPSDATADAHQEGATGIPYLALEGDDWYELDINGGDVFHYIDIGENDRPSKQKSPYPMAAQSTFDDPGCLGRVTSANGLVVVHPDILVTPSRISEALSCPRKGVLSDRIRSYDVVGEAAVMGTVKHMFIESVLLTIFNGLRNHRESIESNLEFPHTLSPLTASGDMDSLLTGQLIERFVAMAIRSNMESLLACDAKESDIITTLKSLVPMIIRFAEICCRIGLFVNIEGTFESSSRKCVSCQFFVIDSIIEVEDTLWGPFLGLKGQIDAVVSGHVELRIYDRDMIGILESFRDSPLSAAVGTFNYSRLLGALQVHKLYACCAPMELKTGKWRSGSSLSHRAQTILYLCMLWLRERHLLSTDIFNPNSLPIQPPDLGILAYLSSEVLKVDVVRASWADVRSLILARNKQAVHIHKCNDVVSNPLPAVIQSESQCSFCFQAAECMAYHAALDRGSRDTSGVPHLFDYSMRGFLTQQHLDYFIKWDHLLDLEASASLSKQYQTWSQPSSRIEGRGNSCCGNLIATACSFDHDDMKADRARINAEWNEERSSRCVLFLQKLMQSSGHENEVSSSNTPFHVGDSVVISLENIWQSAKSSHDKRGAWNYIEPNLSTGWIKSIKDIKYSDHITSSADNNSSPSEDGNVLLIFEISLERTPQRLLGTFKILRKSEAIKDIQLFKRVSASNRRWRVRIDRNEIQYGAATIRTNLLKLFVSPHSPVEFREVAKLFAAQRPKSSDKNSISVHSVQSGNPRMRSLLIDLVRPEFEAIGQKQFLGSLGTSCRAQTTIRDSFSTTSPRSRSHNSVSVPGCGPSELRREFTGLNEGQRDALMKVVGAKDYVLILGMPGTGKTSTVALIVRVLVALGHKVLISSYTHSAVDHLLLKLVDSGMDSSVLLRLGSPQSVDPKLHAFLVDQDDQKGMSHLRYKIANAKVVGCSVLSAARHTLLQCIKFDWCIMDEAGQISQPAAIGPLLHCEKFILIGDDYQLPPLIVSTEAKSLGMDVSLFKRLAEANPHSVTSLKAQYRMNMDIMTLSNALIYEHRLFCGSAKVASARIKLPRFDLIPSPCSINSLNSSSPSRTRSDWLYKALHPDATVLFLDTDSLPPRSPGWTDDVAAGASSGDLTNPDEVEIIEHLVWAFAKCQYLTSRIGIISPYRAQVASIRTQLNKRFDGENVDSELNFDNNGVGTTSASTTKNVPKNNEGLMMEGVVEQREQQRFDVNTVDKFQGRDMEIVIISTVKNKDASTMGDLLRDWRRVNVAITRAQKKIILIGSLSMMKQIPILSALRDTVIANDWVYALPENAFSMYRIQESEC